jgi:hypothetical protein
MAVHSFLEVADAFAKPAHHFGDFLAPEEQHDYGQNNYQMERTQRFHNSPAFKALRNFQGGPRLPVPQSPKYNTLIPHPARHVLAVEVFQ